MGAASPDPIQRVVALLSKLPGIGEKTATRLAFHILRLPSSYAESLAQALLTMRQTMRPCPVCQSLTEQDRCRYCSDPTRDGSRVCVVASLQDLVAIERTGEYTGLYHVLHGLLSPLDGRGPGDVRIQELLERVSPEGPIKEIIIATSPTVEGEATAHYLQRLLEPFSLRITRIASGVPIGGDLEYTDQATLGRAISGRRDM